MEWEWMAWMDIGQQGTRKMVPPPSALSALRAVRLYLRSHRRRVRLLLHAACAPNGLNALPCAPAIVLSTL